MIASMDGGGSERQTLLMLRHLSRERFAPELFVLRRGGTLFDQIPGDVPVHCFEDLFDRSKHPLWLRLPGQIHRAQVNVVRRLIVERSIDVIYDRTFHMTLIAGPATNKTSIPRVSTIVSPPSHAVPQNAGKFLAIKRAKLAAAYKLSAKVLAVSAPVAADACRYYGFSRSHVQAVPNPVDFAELDRAVASTPPPSRDERYTVVCVGRMTQEKGHRELIEAIGHLRRQNDSFYASLRLWLVGDGPLRSQLETLAQSLGVTDCIQFVGHVAQPAPWIAAADALCLPSRFEGFPNVMLEAMALGTPVIASDIPVVRSLGRISSDPSIRGKTYLAVYPSGDSANLARRIVNVRQNSTATRSRRLFADKLAREALAVHAIVPRLEAIMLGVVQEKSPE